MYSLYKNSGNCNLIGTPVYVSVKIRQFGKY